MNEETYQETITNINNGKISEYQLEEGILYRKDKDRLLKVIRRYEVEPVLYFMHDHLLSAHFGIQTTKEKVKEKYYWPKMNNDVEHYVKSCE